MQKRDYHELSTDAQDTLERETRKRAVQETSKLPTVEQAVSDKVQRAKETANDVQRQRALGRGLRPHTPAQPAGAPGLTRMVWRRRVWSCGALSGVFLPVPHRHGLRVSW